MPGCITQLVIGIGIAIGMAVVGVSAIGNAGAFEQSKVKVSDILINRLQAPTSEEDPQFAYRERFRGLFLNERGQLR